MKITGIKIISHTIHHTPRHKHRDRAVGPLDIYEEYNTDARSKSMPMALERNGDELTGAFIVITTDEGIEGIHGPVIYRAQLLVAVEGLAKHIVGRDPLETRLLWDIMSRFERHSRAGLMLMAISVVDIALWDLKGKILGQPVYKLLGGGRGRLRPYASMLGHSTDDLDETRKAALAVKEKGILAQKWFFRHGPASGNEGIKKNLELAFTLREALGSDYELMFDCWMGWNVSYALNIFRELSAVKPVWVEEVLRPHMKDGYRILKANTNIPLSAGEHLYLRQEVVDYLSEGIFRVIQSDPEWCGGITEALRIADLCEVYGTTFIPHGHSLMPAAHIVATMSPEICPYVEYLIHFLEDSMLPFFNHKWLDDDGYITMSNAPGTGLVLDTEIVIRSEEIKGFFFSP